MASSVPAISPVFDPIAEAAVMLAISTVFTSVAHVLAVIATILPAIPNVFDAVLAVPRTLWGRRERRQPLEPAQLPRGLRTETL